MMTIHTALIRQANEEDFGAMAEIYNHYLGKATLHLQPKSSVYFQQMVKDFSPREELWVTVLSGRVIGWSALKKYSPKEGYQRACETSTFFTPEHLGGGYGKNLKSFVLARAKELDYNYVVARIMSQNKRSIAFNINMGYRIVGEQRGIGQIRDQAINVTILEKRL